MASWIDLACAVKTGELEYVRRFVEEDGVDVNMHQSEYGGGKSVLHLAVRRGHSAVVQFLLENNADVNAVDQRGITPLHCDIKHSNGIEILQLLIQHKADVNARDNSGNSPLHLALRYYRGPEVFRFLLDHKADIAATDATGSTALHVAVLNAAQPEAAEVVQCLIDHKAAINAADNFGRTPLHNFFIARRVAPVMAKLLSHDADVHAVDAHLQTPLHVLVARDIVEAVRVLLGHIRSNLGPASIESVLMCVDDENKLPFHKTYSLTMVRVLLEQPLLNNDQVVPRVCHAMLFAKDDSGQSLLDRQQQEGDGVLLCAYLTSYTDLPLTVHKTVQTALPCEHRAKRPRHKAVPFNPNLNGFQRSIATAFLNKWDQSFLQAGTMVGVEHEGLHAMLPDDLKYVIMAYLSPADIMKI